MEIILEFDFYTTYLPPNHRDHVTIEDRDDLDCEISDSEEKSIYDYLISDWSICYEVTRVEIDSQAKKLIVEGYSDEDGQDFEDDFRYKIMESIGCFPFRTDEVTHEDLVSVRRDHFYHYGPITMNNIVGGTYYLELS